MILMDDDGDQSRSVLANMSRYATAQDLSLPAVAELAETMDALRAALGPCPHCGR